MHTESDLVVNVTAPANEAAAAETNCRRLEEGRLIAFPRSPIRIEAADHDFLLRQRQSGAKFHKNIAYRPHQDRVTGVAGLEAEDARRLTRVLRGYSRAVVDFLSTFLEPYASRWKLDYASFRPFQEKGRDLRTRARNDLLHVDSFPTRPTNGDRILRFFTNISPEEPRRWITTDNFEGIVRKFAPDTLPYPLPLGGWRGMRYRLLKAGGQLGMPLTARSPYDEFMLRLHHAMKESGHFQKDCPKIHLEFAPGASWMVFTDLVPHAALSGQYALEQTFLVSHDSLVQPELSPLNVLERLSGRKGLVPSRLR